MKTNHAADLAVIIPTYNESANITELINRVARILQGIQWELVFVDDDSPDGTAQRILEHAQEDSRIRLVRRIGRRGLSSACVEGMLATTAPVLAVMDGDLQHDERLLIDMYQAITQQGHDLAIASRYMEGGGLGDWDDSRQNMSRFAGKLARFVTKVDISDPMSGFFMLRAEILHGCVHKLSLVGYKLLLDILATVNGTLKIIELPYIFQTRTLGESKLDTAVLWEFFLMMLQKFTNTNIPIRFISFSLVGGLGVFVHMAVVYLIINLFSNLTFLFAQSTATLVAMTSNFVLNNVLTYRDQRLHGKDFYYGWISFVLACSVGALANVGVANYLFQTSENGWFLPALAGVAVGAVWNYAVTSIYTWKK